MFKSYYRIKAIKDGFRVLVLTFCVFLAACGGSGDEMESDRRDSGDRIGDGSTTQYLVTISHSKIETLDISSSELTFELSVEGISSSTDLNCFWQPEKGKNEDQAIEFPCSSGEVNTALFTTPEANSYIGQLGVFLPDSVFISSISYTVEDDTNKAVLLDVSDQFDVNVTDKFYVFKINDYSEPLTFFPKKLDLESNPGVASVQRRDLIGDVLEIFLNLSVTDWVSEDQLVFSSRFSLDVDATELFEQAKNIGFYEYKEISVLPPIVTFERRYLTDIPEGKIVLQCEGLTLEVDSSPITLFDCSVSNEESPEEKQTVNLVANATIENVMFDPKALTDNSSIKGNFSIEFTLPGTKRFDSLAESDNVDLSSLFQIYFLWPQAEQHVMESEVTFVWEGILSTLEQKVQSKRYQWNDAAMALFVEELLSEKLVSVMGGMEVSGALKTEIETHIKQELFVSVYSRNKPEDFLFFVPRLRFENAESVRTEEKTVRYFYSSEPIISELDLTCMGAPDVLNNVYRKDNCE